MNGTANDMFIYRNPDRPAVMPDGRIVLLFDDELDHNGMPFPENFTSL